MTKLNDLVAQYFSGTQNTEAHAAKLLTLLMEYWATEKDYELKNVLLKKLIFRYASAERRLVELNQLKNKFLGLAAHDLKNPLVSIRGLSELLLSGATEPLSEMQQEFIETIHAASSSMLALVNDFLDISVIESGKLELQISRGSLQELIEERIKINRMVAEKKGIRLHTHLEALGPVPFDPNRLAQVLDNLIGNAIKFSPHGSYVDVLLHSEDGMVKCSVRDQGPGITPEDQAKLFREFQRLQAQPTGGEKSTGLGLSIVKKIVDAHGGQLAVDSRVGFGSTFSFLIPLEEGYEQHEEAAGGAG
jgi:signal transduction histidine kinase